MAYVLFVSQVVTVLPVILLHETVWRVGKEDSVWVDWMHHDVVGRVEPSVLKLVDYDSTTGSDLTFRGKLYFYYSATLVLGNVH